MFQLDLVLLYVVDKNFLVFAAHDKAFVVALNGLDKVILTFVREIRRVFECAH